MSFFPAFSNRPAPYFNVSHNWGKRHNCSSSIKLNVNHTFRSRWWATHYYMPKPQQIERHRNLPRMLLDRHMYVQSWELSRNLPDETRWETLRNSRRYAAERVHWVEEDGFMHRVNWKLYSDRVNAELQASIDALPQYTLRMEALPRSWKKMDIDIARVRGLSVREAMAQCKLKAHKGANIMYRALEMLQKGAESKGLDKERLRLGRMVVSRGPTDKQVDIRSKGYYAWKTKKSTHLMMTAIEDPEMRLPDRTLLPYASQVALRRAGIPTEQVVLDVPAITAEGI